MRLSVIAGLLWLMAWAAPVSAQFRTVETFTVHGAYGMIVIPANWNGSLFIYAHGYTADKRFLAPLPADLTPTNFTAKLPVLLQASVLPSLNGYAIATTTFRSVGWYVKDAVKDIETLRRIFVRRYGKPKFTYLWGHSGGGMVTAAVIEKFPDLYDGAAPLCGTGAGARRNFNGAFDLRVVYEYACRDVPEARFLCRVCSGGSERCLADSDCPSGQCGGAEPPGPIADGLSSACTDFLLDHPDRFSESATSLGGAFVGPSVRACFGDSATGVPPTPEQDARRDLFLRASQIPADFIQTDLFFATIGMAEVVHRRTGGKHPWGNDGVDYTPPLLTATERAALNANIYRILPDTSAVTYMRKWYEPRGQTHSKVLTVHALDDGLVIPENEDKYRQAFETAGRSAQLVQFQTTVGGHCGFIGELFPTLTAISNWVEKGQKPRLDLVQAACPSCSFTPEKPGPFGLKVVERRQQGAPVGTLVCDGSPGDCPAASDCRVPRGLCGPIGR